MQNAPLKVIDEAHLSAPLDVAIRALLCQCFPDDAQVFGQTRYWHHCIPFYTVVLSETSGVLGHVGVISRAITCGVQRVTVAGIQNVAVDPRLRGCGLGARLMVKAMEEAKRRDFQFGLLFCVPQLGQFYASLGWVKVCEPILMADEQGNSVSAPPKNICMAYNLTNALLPSGAIDLNGRDW